MKRPRKERVVKVKEVDEIPQLISRIASEAPPPGSQLQEEEGKGKPFDSLPLSQRTMKGLEGAGFTVMTPIQLATLPHALAGRDVLGAAKTGSGKTLAFLLPAIEALYRDGWGVEDGLGALILSPTRELALQIFEVLRAVGKHHQLSAGLVTGGKKEFKEEQMRIGRMSILVSTPGRLLQHLEQTPGFDVSNLKVLVLDEADRILDMGFKEQLNSILSYVPMSRQTMLFSATQTRSLKNLIRLSLNKDTVESIDVQDQETSVTPSKLVQSYITCTLGQKLDVLFSFLKSHTKSKLIVFFSSCAQVKFAYSLLCALQPGLPVLALHGKFKQQRRTAIYFDFVRKPAAVLLATDVAARGLDFPSVDWVVQVDAPEDTDAYIHRVGRTARYKSGGRALLLLLPSEEKAMVPSLKEKSLMIRQLTVNPDMMKAAGSCTKKAAAQVAADAEMRRLADKAFQSYIRSVSLMPNKAIFSVEALPLDDFATSLGLPFTPELPKLAGGRDEQRKAKNTNRSLQRLKEQIKQEKARKRAEREGKVVVADKGVPEKEEEEEDGDWLVPSGAAQLPGDDDDNGLELLSSKRKERKRKLRITAEGTAVTVNKRIRFDAAGAEITDDKEEEQEEGAGGLASANESYIAKVKARLQSVDADDKTREKERVRAKHLKQKLKVKQQLPGEDVGGLEVRLASDSEASESSSQGGDHDSSGDSESESDNDEVNTEALEDQEAAVLRMLKGRS
ncbi:unnamed protein product [Chrysoparadoxa australica]